MAIMVCQDCFAPQPLVLESMRRLPQPPATRFRHRLHGYECTFVDYNYHGVGEFIAQFDAGDRSSEFIRDWEPLNGRWPDER